MPQIAESDHEIEIWGDGKQTRSFLYIDECIEAVRRLMDADIPEPINIGSAEMISIDDFALLIMNVAKKDLKIKHIDGPLGVRGRCSHNKLIEEKLGWKPTDSLRTGIETTYAWIHQMVQSRT